MVSHVLLVHVLTNFDMEAKWYRDRVLPVALVDFLGAFGSKFEIYFQTITI